MTTRTVRGAKNWYPTEDLVKKSPAQAQNPTKLRSSLVPGTVLIILAGRFRGKRVVFLKSLKDNTLLVSGPFKVNGVPLRRVNPRYVIATSTRINVSSVDVKKFDVSYFASEKKGKGAATEEEFFGDKEQKKEVKAERVADQKQVDAALIAEIKKQPLLKRYIATSFSLKNGDKPHLLKF